MPTPQNGETHSDNLSVMPTNCLSVFDHFVFDHKGLMSPVFKNANESFFVWVYVRFNFYKSGMYSKCFYCIFSLVIALLGNVRAL